MTNKWHFISVALNLIYGVIFLFAKDKTTGPLTNVFRFRLDPFKLKSSVTGFMFYWM